MGNNEHYSYDFLPFLNRDLTTQHYVAVAIICGGGIDDADDEAARTLVRRKQGFAITPCMLGRVSRRYVARTCANKQIALGC